MVLPIATSLSALFSALNAFSFAIVFPWRLEAAFFLGLCVAFAFTCGAVKISFERGAAPLFFWCSCTLIVLSGRRWHIDGIVSIHTVDAMQWASWPNYLFAAGLRLGFSVRASALRYLRANLATTIPLLPSMFLLPRAGWGNREFHT